MDNKNTSHSPSIQPDASSDSKAIENPFLSLLSEHSSRLVITNVNKQSNSKKIYMVEVFESHLEYTHEEQSGTKVYRLVFANGSIELNNKPQPADVIAVLQQHLSKVASDMDLGRAQLYVDKEKKPRKLL